MNTTIQSFQNLADSFLTKILSLVCILTLVFSILASDAKALSLVSYVSLNNLIVAAIPSSQLSRNVEYFEKVIRIMDPDKTGMSEINLNEDCNAIVMTITDNSLAKGDEKSISDTFNFMWAEWEFIQEKFNIYEPEPQLISQIIIRGSEGQDLAKLDASGSHIYSN